MGRYRELGLLLLLAQLVGVTPASGQLRSVTLVSATGPTTVRRSGAGTFAPAARRMTLASGDLLRTGPNAGAILLFPDGSEIKVRANSVLLIPELSPAAGPQRVHLDQGQIWARVSPGGGARFEAGRTAISWVRGTELDLELRGDETAVLTVAEGEVRLYNDAGSVTVHDGEQSQARPGQAPTPPIAVNLPVLLEWTNALLPAVLIQETVFVSQDPRVLDQAAADAETLRPLGRRRLREADILHDRGELLEALAGYDRALPLAPSGERDWAARLQARRGQTLLELGRLEEAEAAFGQALQEPAAPGARDSVLAARAGLAMTLLARGQAGAAREEIMNGIVGSVSAVELAMPLALIEIRQGAMTAAEVPLRQALEADPKNAQAHAAKSAVLRAKNDLPGAEEEARQAVALAPYSASSRQALASVFLLEGHPSSAEREARQAVALNPLAAPAHVTLADADMLRGKVEEAVREAAQSVTLDPQSDRAEYSLGAALAEQRRYAMAERHLRRAVALNPSLLDAQSLLSRVLVRRGEREEAVTVARGALDRNPELPSAHASLGQVYRLQGRLEEAAREYESALALSPRSGLYHLEVARVYLDRNDLPRALSHALAAVNLLPESSEAHAVLGLVYDREESQEQAVREYREAVSLSPENSLARLGLVTAFTPRLRELQGSGREQSRERAQALLRDPAVVEQVFYPGVDSELAGGYGADQHEQQSFQHRGGFGHGRIYDLTTASRFSDNGYRANGSTNNRLLRSDLAIQATPTTEILLQPYGSKDSGGLPGPITQPDLTAYTATRENGFNLHLRQGLKGDTQLWLETGIRAVRTARADPSAVAQPIFPGAPDLSLFKGSQRGNEHGTELRLDHRAGPHVLSAGLADLRLDGDDFDAQYALPDALKQSRNPPTVLEDLGQSSIKDFLDYLQDDFRIGRRGFLIAGSQWLHTRERNRETLLGPLAPPGAVNAGPERRETVTLPYMAFTYRLNARDRVRLLGNKTRLRVSSPLLVPSEAFIIGEPISLSFVGGPNASTVAGAAAPTTGGAETYELDYERRISPRTFGKLFLQYSLARDFAILPSLTQQFIPTELFVPTARAEIAGLRLERQITPYLSGFARWSYFRVTDASDRAIDPVTGQEDGPNPSRGLQVPFVPHWRGLFGLSYVDRTGTKLGLAATFLSRRFTDSFKSLVDEGAFGAPQYDPTKPRPSTGPNLLVDLHFAKEPSVRLEYSLTVSNLFNSTFPDNQVGFPTRGRTWLVSIATRY